MDTQDPASQSEGNIYTVRTPTGTYVFRSKEAAVAFTQEYVRKSQQASGTPPPSVSSRVPPQRPGPRTLTAAVDRAPSFFQPRVPDVFGRQGSGPSRPVPQGSGMFDIRPPFSRPERKRKGRKKKEPGFFSIRL